MVRGARPHSPLRWAALVYGDNQGCSPVAYSLCKETGIRGVLLSHAQQVGVWDGVERHTAVLNMAPGFPVLAKTADREGSAQKTVFLWTWALVSSPLVYLEPYLG